MGAMKTPGVYIKEKKAFSNSVVEVATAIPAFIGHTAMADNKNKPLHRKPWRITSLAEYQQYYGGGPFPLFNLAEHTDPGTPADFKTGGKAYSLVQPAGQEGGRYLMYSALRHFFLNGGGACYIVSVGDYTQDPDPEAYMAGIDELLKEQEPTLLVIPDAVLFSQPDCIKLQQAMLSHCGEVMRNRVAILDLWGGDKSRKDPAGDPVALFRDSLGINHLDFAAAYYPWLNTSIVGLQELSFENILNRDLLIELLLADQDLPATLPAGAPPKVAAQWQAIQDLGKDWSAEDPAAVGGAKALLNKTLCAFSGLFNTVLAAIQYHLNVLPPSAAMAGIYTMVDNSRGVWKAPANVSVNGVISPCVTVSAADQEDLNVTTAGKSINAIRAFIGEGTLVWGARTLDGNSLDWRYINVRRTMIMLEESCRLATKAMVFEPNVAGTWVNIRSMIESVLTDIWRRGGLAGAVPTDAFSVHVGLGETMTAEDILEGILRVTVLVAITRPAEFIEITFQQQLQAS